MNLKLRYNVFATAGALLLLFFSSCEKKVDSTQETNDIITARTVGLAYLEENLLDEAEKKFIILIQLAPEEAMAYANLGLVYFRMGRYSKAENQVKKALSIDSNDPDIRLILSEIFMLTQRENDALKVLKTTLEQTPDHVKTLYKIAELYGKRLYISPNDIDALKKREQYLRKIGELAPANIPVRIQLIEILLRLGKTDTALMHMEQIEQQMPDIQKEALVFFDKALMLMRALENEKALTQVQIVHNILKVTKLYQAGIMDLKGAGGHQSGFPVLTFSQDLSLRINDQKSILNAIRFKDVTTNAGLDIIQRGKEKISTTPGTEAVLAVADYDNDGDQDLYVTSLIHNKTESINYLFRNDMGQFVDVSAEAGIKHSGKDMAVVFADYDNDGYLDIFVANTDSNRLYKNIKEGKFRSVGMKVGLLDSSLGYAALFADFDHEGDLDLFLATTARNRLYRNNLDGTFTELSKKMGIAGGNVLSRDAIFGDFDEDGDLDLFVVNEDTSNQLYTNLRQGRFLEITETSGLTSDGNSGSATAGDYNNDGFLDLFVTALSNGSNYLYRNNGNGTFEKDVKQIELYQALDNIIGLDVCFFDFDNDGFLDLLVVGEQDEKRENGSGIRLFHNDGTGSFKDVSTILPPDLTSGYRIAVADYNEDGDMDIFIAGINGGVKLLRNDGGNINKYLKVQLVGLRAGSGKNNHFGIGSKLEVSVGDLYQMRVVTEPVTHFGIGQKLKADVVRIQWPNGVPQNLFYPGSDQDIVENQILKGSCVFLYAWNGQKYEFVTDVLWRSALGMPRGIMGGTTIYAFPNSADEYLKIPRNMIKAKDGKYSFQFTEELWETPYLDQIKLIVLDHPDSVDIFIDERFFPPPFSTPHIYAVSEKFIPKSAMDGKGNNVIQKIREQDDKYVSTLMPEKFQGVMTMHDLILDLGELSQAEQIILFLNGWLYPTDASINVSMSQSDKIKTISPILQVVDRNGHWKTVIDNLGFPMGKKKTVIADLTDKFLSEDYRVRIRTNMQIYWDYIFFSTEEVKTTVKKTVLQPVSAEIHYRGFSRVYRKGGRYGPHWFDYSDVSIEPKWRDLTGYYTRYGDVLPLLLDSDDMYVILNSGDEITVTFDADRPSTLNRGWTRDFLIYTDGWLKDGDLNTAQGKTVLPLPFHGMSSYPFGEGENYPMDYEHRLYLNNYNTRKVTNENYRRVLWQ